MSVGQCLFRLRHRTVTTGSKHLHLADLMQSQAAIIFQIGTNAHDGFKTNPNRALWRSAPLKRRAGGFAYSRDAKALWSQATGLTDRIFIDASHARIHHVVGVLHQVDKLMSAIEANLKTTKRTLRIGTKGNQQDFSTSDLARFVQKRRPVVRFIGLLHDLTHAPFGHTVEDEIGLVRSKHDEPERQADAFYRLLCQLVAWL